MRLPLTEFDKVEGILVFLKLKFEGILVYFGATLNSLNLDSKKTALVIIDLQNAIVGMNTAPHPAAQIVENSKNSPKPSAPTAHRSFMFAST